MQEKKIKFTDVLFVGLAFFASYFGAGNLIFPPMLGLQSGSNWLSGMIGMLASGVGLPILAIIVLGMCGSVQKISDHVNKKFYTVMIGAIMILCCCVSMAENGLALAKFFESHPKVEKVYYPGLESSPSKALADKQFEGNGYGGMLCVNFKGGQKEIDKLISNLQLVRFVPTLAGVGTTLTYPPRASHRDLSPDELAAIGITMGQIRLSSGLEDTDDLLNDFDQALAKM